MSEMRVLTVRQPWAWAIIHGGKDVENRVRNIAGSYRGPVAIHAGLAHDETATGLILQAARGDWYLNHASGHEEVEPWNRDHGCIIGVVDLIEVHRVEDCIKQQADGDWLVCSEWAERSGYHLKLAAPRTIQPVPYTGALGLRRLPAGVITECICYWLDPKYWHTEFGATDPASQMEPCYDCPVHFPSEETK